MKSRNPIVGAIAVGLIVFVAYTGPAHATLDETAGPFVMDLATRVVDVFTNQDVSVIEKAGQFLDLFHEGFAVKALAIFTLGRYSGSTDEALIDEYLVVFDEYISLSYTARFSSRKKVIFEIVEVKPDKDVNGAEDGVQVITHISTPGGEPVEVAWRVREYRDKPIIVDVLSSGVSLANTQRKEFISVIGNNGGDVQALLTVLREKNAELRQN